MSRWEMRLAGAQPLAERENVDHAQYVKGQVPHYGVSVHDIGDEHSGIAPLGKENLT